MNDSELMEELLANRHDRYLRLTSSDYTGIDDDGLTIPVEVEIRLNVDSAIKMQRMYSKGDDRTLLKLFVIHTKCSLED